MSVLSLTKEVVTNKDNYSVYFEISKMTCFYRINEVSVSGIGEQLQVGNISISRETKVNDILNIIKERIKDIEEPSRLYIDLLKWDGNVRYDISQEEKNSTLEQILDTMIDAIDDAGGLTDETRNRFDTLLDKFKGFR